VAMTIIYCVLQSIIRHAGFAHLKVVLAYGGGIVPSCAKAKSSPFNAIRSPRCGFSPAPLSGGPNTRASLGPSQKLNCWLPHEEQGACVLSCRLPAGSAPLVL